MGKDTQTLIDIANTGARTASVLETSAEMMAAFYERSQQMLDQLIKIAEAVDRPHRYIVRLRDHRAHTELFDILAFSAKDATLQAEIIFRSKHEIMPYDQLLVLELRPANEQKDGPYGG